MSTRRPGPALVSTLFCYIHLDGLLSPQMIGVYLGVSGGSGDHFPPAWGPLVGRKVVSFSSSGQPKSTCPPL